jgi:rhodanese-related sulfurtransferase
MESSVDTEPVPSLSPAEFIARLGGADAPLVLDVRRRERFLASDWMLPGAEYCAPEDVASFARSRTPREVVVYCVYGHNVSADAVRVLREAGWDARALAGGIEGGEPGVDAADAIAEWQALPVPRIRKRAE